MEQAQNLFVETFGGEGHRDFVNVRNVGRGDHAGFVHVAEQSDFRFQVVAERTIAAANQNIGLNADAEKFFHAVLRGLGLQFAGRRDEGHEREVHEDDAVGAVFEAHLADGFEERKRLDVANRAADFDERDV